MVVNKHSPLPNCWATLLEVNEADWEQLVCIPSYHLHPLITKQYRASCLPNKITPPPFLISIQHLTLGMILISLMFLSEIVKLCFLPGSFLLLGFSCGLRGGRVHRALFGLVGFWCSGARGGRTQQVRTTLDFLVPWVACLHHHHQLGDEKPAGHLVFKGVIIGLQPCTLRHLATSMQDWVFKLGGALRSDSEGLQPCVHLANGHLYARLGLQIGCEGGGLHGQSAVFGENQPASFQGHLASSVFEVCVCGSISRVLYFGDDHQDNDIYDEDDDEGGDDDGGVGSDIGGNRQCVGWGGLTDTICHKPNIPSPLSPG